MAEKVAALLIPAEDVKMMRETLCKAQFLVNQRMFDKYSKKSDSDYIQTLIFELDRHRPLGSDGKHGNLHTETCGCDLDEPSA